MRTFYVKVLYAQNRANTLPFHFMQKPQAKPIVFLCIEPISKLRTRGHIQDKSCGAQ